MMHLEVDYALHIIVFAENDVIIVVHTMKNNKFNCQWCIITLSNSFNQSSIFS